MRAVWRSWTLASVFLLALTLRCLALGRFSFGYDEIQEIRWSNLAWPGLVGAAAAEGAHPPLEFVLQGVLGRLGAADWTRALPSVLAGAATVWLLALLGARWFGDSAGLATGLLLACSPIHVRFSQETRPYALGLFCLVASVMALDQFRRRPSRLVWLAWFAAVLGAAYTLYFAGLVAVLVSVCFLFLYRDAGLRPLWRTLPLSLGGWLVLYAPWFPVVLSVAERRPEVGRETLDLAWWANHLQMLGTGDWQAEPLSAGSCMFWLLVVAGLLLAPRSRPARLASLWLLLGSAIQLAVLQAHPHFPAVRHFMPSWLGGFVLAGFAVSKLQERKVSRVVGWLAVGLVLVFDAKTLAAYYDHGRPDWNAVALYLRRTAHPGERLFASNSWTFDSLSYYWNDEGLGRPGLPLERVGGEISGPSWLVLSVCYMTPEVRSQVEGLPLTREFPRSNHCQVRFVPPGTRRVFPSGLCGADVWPR